MMFKPAMFFLLVVLLALLPSHWTDAQDDAGGEDVDNQFMGNPQFPAPDFPTGLDWLNVPAPLTLEALRGKVVILDFWTYGCINCIHMIPVLRRLEEKFPDELVVIGVHSAKFLNEGETDNIRQIVQRYELRHPVINDHEFRTWDTFRPYGVNAWPTFVVIDPRGNLLAVQPGEIPFAAFDRVISGVVNTFDGLGEINREPVELALEGANEPNTALLFPGKVLADAAGSRLFIADSNHHRIVVADLLTYEVLDIIGTGERGLNDGVYEAATFNKPQGMALNAAGTILYIADTENHAVRRVDLEAREVSTIAGTGEQGYNRLPGNNPTGYALNSPWDVALDEDILFIAMAGPHQLWALLLDDNRIGPLVGSGREGLLDGAFTDAELAQPSGLHYADGKLYFADSESSSIRVADVDSRTVTTLAGPLDNNLFDFGDADGAVGVSRLQHPLGVTGTDGALYVADTYNSRIKRIDLATSTTTTLFGLDEHGFRDGGADEAAFYEPGGIDYAGGKLYVADTNNHAIRVIDLTTNTVSTVAFPNPEALQMEDELTVVGGNSALGVALELPEQTVAPGEGEIVLRVALPEGFKINPLAPSQSAWNSEGEAVEIDEANRAGRIETVEARVPVTLREGTGALRGLVTVYYCEAEAETLCYLDEASVTVPVRVTADAAATSIIIERVIMPPEMDATLSVLSNQ